MPVGARPRSRRPVGHSSFPSPAFSSTPKTRRPLSAVRAVVAVVLAVVGRRPINQRRRDDTDAQEVARRPLSQSVVDITYRQGQSARITAADDDSRMLSAAPLRAKRCPLSSRTRPGAGRQHPRRTITPHHPLNPSITFTPYRPSCTEYRPPPQGETHERRQQSTQDYGPIPKVDSGAQLQRQLDETRTQPATTPHRSTLCRSAESPCPPATSCRDRQ